MYLYSLHLHGKQSQRRIYQLRYDVIEPASPGLCNFLYKTDLWTVERPRLYATTAHSQYFGPAIYYYARQSFRSTHHSTFAICGTPIVYRGKESARGSFHMVTCNSLYRLNFQVNKCTYHDGISKLLTKLFAILRDHS